MAVSDELGAEREVALDGGKVRYRERGDGAPIVFVHPIFTNGDHWRDVVPPLADQYRCITPDWPLGSHEIPMEPDADLSPPGLARLAAEFLDTLDLRDVTLVGNDTGGAISQLVVAGHPERVGRVVLVSCDAFEVFPPRLFAYLKLMARTPGASFVAAQSLRSRAFRRLPITYGWVTHRLDKAAGDSYIRPLARHRRVRRDANEVIRGMHPRHTLAAAEHFAGFDRPVMVVWGEDDRIFPESLGSRLAYAFPNARLERVAGARTFVPEDRPAQLAALIRDFLADAGQGAPPVTARAVTDPDPQQTKLLHEAMPFAAVLGVDALPSEPGEVRARVAWEAERCTSGDALHGGVIMALADTCGGACAFANLPEGAIGTTTIESKSNFFRAVRSGWIEATARPLHVGRTTIVVETDVFDDAGERVARVTQTQAVLHPQR